jgi:hypothetical protein
MRIDEKIINEIKRHNDINRYIVEQDVPPPTPEEPLLPPAPGAEPALPPAPGGETPPAAPAPPEAPPTPQPVDVENDPDVEKVGEEKGEKREELEITDLVKSQKEVSEKQEEYFNNLFSHLDELESKLSNMDAIVNKLNDLEAKVEKYRPKTNQEKLELRTLDSGPFNQKLTSFFEDKMEDMEKTGKNEYILTSDDVESYSPNEIKKSFRDFSDEDEDNLQDFKEVK